MCVGGGQTEERRNQTTLHAGIVCIFWKLVSTGFLFLKYAEIMGEKKNLQEAVFQKAAKF